MEAERLCSLQVDGQFVLDRGLHRQVGWLLAPEDAVDIAAAAVLSRTGTMVWLRMIAMSCLLDVLGSRTLILVDQTGAIRAHPGSLDS